MSVLIPTLTLTLTLTLAPNHTQTNPDPYSSPNLRFNQVSSKKDKHDDYDGMQSTRGGMEVVATKPNPPPDANPHSQPCLVLVWVENQDAAHGRPEEEKPGRCCR